MVGKNYSFYNLTFIILPDAAETSAAAAVALPAEGRKSGRGEPLDMHVRKGANSDLHTAAVSSATVVQIIYFNCNYDL